MQVPGRAAGRRCRSCSSSRLLAAVGPIDLPGTGGRRSASRTGRPTRPASSACTATARPPAGAPPGTGASSRRRRGRRSRAAPIAIGPVIYATNGEAPGEHPHGPRLRHPQQALERTDQDAGRPQPQPGRPPTAASSTSPAATSTAKTPTDSLWRYDPRTERWQELPPMGLARGRAPGTRWSATSSTSPAAGRRPSASTSQGQPLRPARNLRLRDATWETGPDMPVPRHHTVAVGLGRQALRRRRARRAAGHQQRHSALDEFDRYDPASEEWERLPPHAARRRLHGDHHGGGQGRDRRRRGPAALGGRRRLGRPRAPGPSTRAAIAGSGFPTSTSSAAACGAATVGEPGSTR